MAAHINNDCIIHRITREMELRSEGTTKFLFNVPRFQLYAPIQIHGKSCSHIKWLQKANHSYVDSCRCPLEHNLVFEHVINSGMRLRRHKPHPECKRTEYQTHLGI